MLHSLVVKYQPSKLGNLITTQKRINCTAQLIENRHYNSLYTINAITIMLIMNLGFLITIVVEAFYKIR